MSSCPWRKIGSSQPRSRRTSQWKRALRESPSPALLDFAQTIESVAGDRMARVCLDCEESEPQESVDRDAALLEAAIAADDTNPLLRIWTNGQCLVATRAQSALAGYDKAVAAATAAGWPVVLRRSGGTTVPHGPGVLNISLIHALGTAAIDGVYHPLLQLIVASCAQIGIAARIGGTPHCFCDGTRNVIVDGLKFAGTAAFMRNGPQKTWCLAHASIMVDPPMETMLSAVTRFERDLGWPADYQPSAHVTLAEAWRVNAMQTTMGNRR
jgi:octanoyl-[GcvH]:protein N-octanoyltransferase